MENQETTLEQKNAIIIEASVGADNPQGVLTASLTLQYEGNVQQVFGGYVLFKPESSPDHATQINYAGLFLSRVMQVIGVKSWDKLVGHAVRVRADDKRIDAIGHIIANQWFEPLREFRQLQADANAASPALPLVRLLERVRGVIPDDAFGVQADVDDALKMYGTEDPVDGAI